MVDLAEAVDADGKPFLARLELQGQVQRIMAGLVQIAAVEPQRRLLRRLLHVAQFTFPGTGVLRGRGAQAPALADPVCNFL